MSRKKPSPSRPRARRTDPTSLADYAREVMRRRGILPFHVAQGTKLHHAVVNRWFSGERGITLNSFQKIFDYLGLMPTEGPPSERN